ncbi:MAG: phosphate/phosphite/phosphonate ABC transporter substrate-binding protein [Trichloromonas sp.]|jgi:phosphonate transport system substrate-binding protein|nr:phosphate/phosphite/phosphonate ABC transporter substrate-binding protein [Trichloromonas sp.]
MVRWAKCFFFCCCLLVLTACEEETPRVVNLAERVDLPAIEQRSNSRELRLSIGSIITPEQGYVYYRQLIDYLSERLDLAITVVDPGNYLKLNTMLKNGDVDVAFVCSGPYVEGRETFGLELLAAPVVNGEAAYYSNLIVPASSPAKSLADLQGKSFAFTDPQSNSGCLVPRNQLAQRGYTPESFFDSFSYTYAHDRSIHAVAEGLVDGAAVDSLIWDYLSADDPKLKQRVRVVERFGPFAIPPVVAAPHVPQELREKFRQALLTMHQNPQGQKILQGMHIERFTPIDDGAYESIRRMLNTIGQEKP